VPGGCKPDERKVAVWPIAKAMMFQLTENSKPMPIAVPVVRKPQAEENAAQGPKADIRENVKTKPAKSPTIVALKKKPQSQIDIQMLTYVEKMAASGTEQNKQDEQGFQTMGKKKTASKVVSGLVSILTNKHTKENRGIAFKRINRLTVSPGRVLGNVSAVNTAYHTNHVPADIRMIGISTNVKGTITALQVTMHMRKW
jgi:hypothetical protein